MALRANAHSVVLGNINAIANGSAVAETIIGLVRNTASNFLFYWKSTPSGERLHVVARNY